jgi:hypothetical protein
MHARAGAVRRLTEILLVLQVRQVAYAALLAREDGQRDMRDRYSAHRRIRKYKPYPSLRSLAFTDYLRPAVILALNTGR